MGDEGPRPGLLILDMSNDQIKGVAYNKAAVLTNVAQLALSDFFHVCIDSKQEVPGFRAKQKGAKLVDELVSMEHINHFDKKEDSALTNPKVLESLKGLKKKKKKKKRRTRPKKVSRGKKPPALSGHI